MERDPHLEQWLDQQEGSEPLEGAHQLTALMLIVHRDQPAEVPDLVMRQWHSLLAATRRTADQSEPAFIAQARRQGWEWERIAQVLGLPDATAAEQRLDVLAAELDRTNPNNLPQPWLGRELDEDG